MTISVVIPSYNEGAYIGRLLKALRWQTFKDFEVIISDAQSRDGTAEVVNGFKDKLNIEFIESPPKGPGAGRNAGARRARGQWLLFLDADDDIKDPDFIRKLFTETMHNGWNTSSARFQPNQGNRRERFGLWLDYHYIKLLAKTKHPVAPGWCIFTKRAVFEKNNGFDERIQFGEDYDYVSRAASGKFGFVENTHYFVDMRRSRGDRWLFLRGTINEIYRHTHRHQLHKTPVKYEFGKHGKHDAK